MSDTPRTDALRGKIMPPEELLGEITALARTLERDLVTLGLEADAEIERLTRELHDASYGTCDCRFDEGGKAIKECMFHRSREYHASRESVAYAGALAEIGQRIVNEFTTTKRQLNAFEVTDLTYKRNAIDAIQAIEDMRAVLAKNPNALTAKERMAVETGPLTVAAMIAAESSPAQNYHSNREEGS